MTFEVNNLTRRPKPKIAWRKIKEEVLGKKFDVSLVLSENKLMKKINEEYRKKNNAADALSFCYSKNEGEILLNINRTKKELISLFIHSLLHLTGLKHGQKMEKLGKKYYNKLYGARHNNNN